MPLPVEVDNVKKELGSIFKNLSLLRSLRLCILVARLLGNRRRQGEPHQ